MLVSFGLGGSGHSLAVIGIAVVGKWTWSTCSTHVSLIWLLVMLHLARPGRSNDMTLVAPKMLPIEQKTL